MLLIHDETCRQSAEAIGLAHRLVLRRLADLESLPGEALVLIDLGDPTTVAACRALPRPPGAAPKLHFVINPDADRFRQLVQANALGSSGNLTVTQVAGFLAQHPPSRATASGGALARPRNMISAAPGLRSVSRQFGRLFTSAAEGQPVSAEEVISMGSAVVAGVRSLGWRDWLDAVRNHHDGTFQHCLLVAGLAGVVARHDRLQTAGSEVLVHAAILHDIGKAAIPLEILDKPGALTPYERRVIETHPREGVKILEATGGIPGEVRDAVLHHHEMLDGSGYPDRLAAPQIPRLTRLLTVCDIFAALIERRSYKAPMSPAEAIAKLVEMVLAGKLDFAAVHLLANALDIHLPDSARSIAARR